MNLGNRIEDEIVIYYKTTKMQKLGIIISGISTVSVIMYIIILKRRKKLSEIIEIPKYNKNEIKQRENEYCICIPIYNEGERIKNELEKANEVMLYKHADIILLDGGSTDGSTAEDNLKKYNVNTLITMEEKGTYKQAEALKAGFNFAIQRSYRGVVTLDGNNKDNIKQALDIIKELKNGFDYIQGSRFIEGGKHENTPRIRHIAIKYIHAPIISYICKKRYTDTTNLFRGYSMKYLTDKRVQPFRKIFKAYELSTYLSIRADQIGLKTCEIPVERCYPKEKKYPTKVGKVKGNLLLMQSLYEALIGIYNFEKN